MTIETMKMANKRTILADKLRKKKANKWKKRIIGGLVGLVGATSVLTNINFWSTVDNFIPGAFMKSLEIPAKWYVSASSLHGSIRTEKNTYLGEIAYKNKSKSINTNLDRYGNLNGEDAYFFADYENIFSGAMKLP